MDEVEKLCQAFLWSSIALNCHKAEMTWSDVCQPLQSGGLGIKQLKIWNHTLLFIQIWAIEHEKERMWSQWINAKYLKNKSIYDVNTRQQAPCVWKTIMKLCDMSIQHSFSPAMKYSFQSGYLAFAILKPRMIRNVMIACSLFVLMFKRS